MSTPPEEIIWQGHPSHATNFWLHLSCLLLVPIPWSFIRWIQVRNHRIEITTQRIRVTTGIFAKKSDELELYRVRDFTFVQPFLLRLFGKGNLIMTTGDASTPVATLPGVPADSGLRDTLRQSIESCRDRKRARIAELGGIDVDDGVSPHP